MAIYKKRKFHFSRHWKLHLLTAMWAMVVVAMVVAAARISRRAHADMAISQAMIEPLCSLALPANVPDTAVHLSGFTVHFNARRHVPNYVAYVLTHHPSRHKTHRSPAFYACPTVKGCPMPNDYYRSHYHRGHMAPAADFAHDSTALAESFAMVNVCPQTALLNSGPWRRLEEKVREWVQRDSVLLVFAGPIFSGSAPTIGPHTQVQVPSHYFKVVLSPWSKPAGAIAFIMPNDSTASAASLTRYIVSVDEVERRTGFRFFTALPQHMQQRLKTTCNDYQWFQF